MHYKIADYHLRKPESSDTEPLRIQKNDPEVAEMLGGFRTGYSRDDIADWIAFHRKCADEVLWVIADGNDVAVGHVGLYKIDFRVRSAEFAIMIGAGAQGRGLGRACSRFMLTYGFEELNLNRVYLEVLDSNERAQHLYRTLGFSEEGRLRQAQYKAGRYHDVVLMGLLRQEFKRDDE